MAKKVLIVEDEPALQNTLGNALRGAGFTIFSALNGEDGIRMAREERPDMVLLDLILPRKSGFDVLEALKKDSVTTHIPVMVLTNLESAGDVDRALELGAISFLVKVNYDLEDIIARIRQAMLQHGG